MNDEMKQSVGASRTRSNSQPGGDGKEGNGSIMEAAHAVSPAYPGSPSNTPAPSGEDFDPVETREWLDSLQYVLKQEGPERVRFLIRRLMEEAAGAAPQWGPTTAYVNTIPVGMQPDYPGDRQMERKIRNIMRWNAMAMVVKGNKVEAGIGGHISTYQSVCTLFEVGFNHFFRAPSENHPGDIVYFQGHASPGIYARAYLEDRLTEDHLKYFRRELQDKPGLSSYPHPWLMPDFWQFPTVSMGLGPITSIYQARFNRYLTNRGLMPDSDQKVWAFLGDGEMDEPESTGAITVASREGLDNLIWVVNCNLQRLDGPVRGNGKIIQELEGLFRGAGWNVIKVIWGDKWDELLAADTTGLLIKRMGEVPDGQYQKYVVSDGAFIRQDFFGKYPELLKLVEHLSDDEIARLPRGGHDHKKVYAAYKAAMEHRGAPTVILAKTVKGYGLGEAGEGRNVAHNQKKLNEEELVEFQKRFDIPVPGDPDDLAFFKPDKNSEELKYLHARRRELGGYLPQRNAKATPLKAPTLDAFQEFLKGSGGREASSTMAFVRMFGELLRDQSIGKLLVPIIPDEARTFGMEPLFRQSGIYSPKGQIYEPVDKETLLYYREAINGQILEEGITEAGSMSSFIAAGTAYATHGINMIPFFIFYSMFGFQRVGDLIWAAADTRTRGFLMGGTAGRTTLNGEGLQHEDGHTHVMASTVPNCISYDPAYIYEIAVIVQDGIRRMYQEQEDVFYYVTLMNENYEHPAMPEGAEEGIRRGIYKLRAHKGKKGQPKVQLFGSGTILRQVEAAQELLDKYGVSADVWSVTSYNELRREAQECERWNRLHPTSKAKVPYITQVMEKEQGPVVAASDYMKILPDSIGKWVPQGVFSLGTDGFGRSDSRAALRRFFEVDSANVAAAALYQLALSGEIEKSVVSKAVKELGINPEAPTPWKV
jgi:pyruvate dehydrogenase E1 component